MGGSGREMPPRFFNPLAAENDRTRTTFVNDHSLAPGDVPPVGEREASFEADARAAGIVLPKRSKADPSEVVAIVVALIVLTAGIGEVTGWVNLHSPSQSSGTFET